MRKGDANGKRSASLHIQVELGVTQQEVQRLRSEVEARESVRRSAWTTGSSTFKDIDSSST